MNTKNRLIWCDGVGRKNFPVPVSNWINFYGARCKQEGLKSVFWDMSLYVKEVSETLKKLYC